MPSFVEKFHYSGQLLPEKPLNCGYPSGKLHTKREGPRFARALIKQNMPFCILKIAPSMYEIDVLPLAVTNIG